jgi:hypothetical protein
MCSSHIGTATRHLVRIATARRAPPTSIRDHSPLDGITSSAATCIKRSKRGCKPVAKVFGWGQVPEQRLRSRRALGRGGPWIASRALRVVTARGVSTPIPAIPGTRIYLNRIPQAVRRPGIGDEAMRCRPGPAQPRRAANRCDQRNGQCPVGRRASNLQALFDKDGPSSLIVSPFHLHHRSINL